MPRLFSKGRGTFCVLSRPRIFLKNRSRCFLLAEESGRGRVGMHLRWIKRCRICGLSERKRLKVRKDCNRGVPR
jgi:hypothetical protein